ISPFQKELVMLKSRRFWIAGVLVLIVFTLCFPLFTLRESSAHEAFDTLPDFPCYRTLDTVFSDAASLAINHPNLAEWLDIGDSWIKQNSGGTSGYDLNILKLTNKNTSGIKPVLFVMSALHARDLAPVELNLHFAEHLLSGYGSNPEITWLLDETEIHFLLVANPDGRAVVEEQIASGWAGADGMNARMKNLNATTCPTQPSNTGTDLRRNFSVEWAGGYSGCTNIYSGTYALSEPESSSIQAYLDDIFLDYRDGDPSEPVHTGATSLFLNIESFGDTITYPFYYTANPAPEEAELYILANKLAYDLDAFPDNPDALLHGTPEDYVYGELGIPALAYAIGGSSEGQYFMNCWDFDHDLNANLNMLIRAAKASFAPYSLPAGPEITSFSIQSDLENRQTNWFLSAIAKNNLYKLPLAPSPIVASAVYSFDLAPWQEGAVLHDLQPEDGFWDEAEEALFAELDVSTLQPGQHRVYVQAALVNGTSGLASAGTITITLEPLPTSTPIVDGYDNYLPIINK
nr:M14 family zinc carboxypeptidase [Anaerolineaceae bacterium]